MRGARRGRAGALGGREARAHVYAGASVLEAEQGATKDAREHDVDTSAAARGAELL